MSIEGVGSVRLSGSARTLTIWAGRSIAAMATLHLVFFTVVSWDYLPGWLEGTLWANVSLDAPMSQSEAHFWPFLGSFAVPLLLLGLVMARLAHQGIGLPAYATWTIAAWVLVCSLVLEPSGFPLGLIPSALLIAAWRAKS